MDHHTSSPNRSPPISPRNFDNATYANLPTTALPSITALPVIAEISADMGTTKESLLQSDEDKRWRSINHIQDAIRNIAMDNEPPRGGVMNSVFRRRNAQAKIVVVADTTSAGTDKMPLVVVAVDARDRPGLLLDVSRTLIRLGLNFHHTEAIVKDDGWSLSL